MRVDCAKQFPAGAGAMASLEQAVRASTLEPGLLELVRIRASQINRCAYCLAMHNRDARARGEHATRLGTEVTSLDGLDLPDRPGEVPGPGGDAR